jgi:phosphoribosylglycinamide formyltransferase 1
MANGPLFDPKAAGRKLRVAAFMSGSGTNITTLLELNSPDFEVAFIFSDTATDKCRGLDIARRFDLPYFAYDTRRFHEVRGLKRTVRTQEGMSARRAYDQVAAKLIQAFEVDFIALGGYMSFLTLTGAVNVHPADLSLVGEDGSRTFVGDDAVYDAILAGQSEIRSSTLFTDLGVDSGPLLMVSDALTVELPAPLAELKADPERLRQVADDNQERLKRAGD